MQKLILFFFCLTLFACSVQKRKYQKGYYLAWHHSPKNNVGKNAAQSLINKSKNNLEDQQLKPLFQKSTSQTLHSENRSFETPASDSKLKLVNDSCDTIIYRDGSELQGKIIEITPTQIKYKRCDLLNGPLYVVKKSEVFMIKYFGGVREVIKEEPPAYTPPADRPTNVAPSQTSATPQNKFQVTHPKAIRAFINGLLSFLSFLGIGTTLGPLLFLFSLTAAIISIVASVKAIKQISAFPNDFKGKGLAMTGRIFSIVILSIVMLFILIIILAS